MGATNTTPVLDLPQFVDDDRPTWRGDINGAFGLIDAAISADRGNIGDIIAGFDQSIANYINESTSQTRIAGRGVWVENDTNVVNALHHGVIGDGVTDDTAALNALLDAFPGRTILLPATPTGYVFAGTINITHDGTALRMEAGTELTFSVAAQDGIKVIASGVTIEGGIINCPAVFDGTNTAWTYAIINVPETSRQFTMHNVTVNNIPRVGVGCRSADAIIVDNRFYGNFPAEAFTNLNTAHYAIQLDPPADNDGGQGLVTGNIIQGCVQGVSLANFGIGTGYGYIITNNRFYNCWNHGIYAQNGVGNILSHNTFYNCQIPIVISTPGAVIGNTIYSSDTGNPWDAVGISGRDLTDCIIALNTIVGDSTPTSVGISVDNINSVSIQRVLILNNTLNLQGPGGQSAIRLGTLNKTTTLTNCKVNGNVCRTPGIVGAGIIGIYTSGPTVFGYGNESCDNTLIATGQTHGIVVNNQKGFRCDNNTVKNEYNAPAAQTLIHVQMSNCVGSTARNLISMNAVGFGANVTVQCLRADTNSTNATLGPVKMMHESGLAAVTQFIDTGTNNVKIQDIGNFVSATTLGVVTGKLSVCDGAGNVVGYVPVYGSIT